MSTSEQHSTDFRSSSFRPVTISSGVRAAAFRTPNKVALTDGQRHLRFAELVERANRVAHGVRDGCGLKRGDHAALMAPNCLEFLEIACGLSDAGVVTAMVNPKLTVGEAAYIVNDSQARVLFVHPSLEEMMREADLYAVEEVIVLGGRYNDWIAQASSRLPRVELAETDEFAIPYTAGTTGNPKGVLLSHRSRVLTFFAMAVEYGCFSCDDQALAIAPLFHGGGFAFAMAPIFFNGTCHILPKFEPDLVLRLLAERGITNTFMVPTHFNAIFSLENSLTRDLAFPSLRTIISNAAPLAQATKEKIVDFFGADVLYEAYGSTEASIVCNLRPADQLRKQRCVGLPFPCTEVQLLGEDGNETPTGEVGELYSRSPYLFNGYWKQPETTAASMRGDWFSAGDLARRDEEGFIYLVDRRDDLIISGGVNIYPREVEEVLHSHPAVMEAAVVGASDEYWGEKVTAFVVRRPLAETTSEQLIQHCQTSLARYKLPKTISFVDALPRNAAGKVLRRELRELLGPRR